MPCPAENTVLRYLGGDLDDPAIREIEEHLDGCKSCRFVFADLARGSEANEPTAVPANPLSLVHATNLARGTLVGRYVMLATLGRGGMGVVYKAFDPELDRTIALKLVGVGALGSQPEQAQARLLREAKTLARLSHPNVVAVHDVGTYEDDVFVAMEFVAGGTLRAWVRERTRTPREILGLFLAAGAGLAAAHRLGIVHRDFKPENVMVGDDARVRVVDFGLARSLERPLARPSLPAIARPATGDPELTREGMIVGTPAYMAPEQDLGHEVDARSDQFSFCAALYEALYGVRAFEGGGYTELAERRLAGDVRPPPKLRGVPSKVRRALLTGLRVDPAERHASMDALLLELGAGRWTGRTRVAVAALAATTLVAGGWAIWVTTHAAPSVEDSCALAADDVTRVWNPKRRAQLVASFDAVGVPEARVMAERVGALVDRWTAEWSSRRTEVCELTMRGDRDAEAHAADRLQCLRDRLSSLDAAVSVCTHAATPMIVQRADVIIEQTPSARDCDDARNTTPIVTDETRDRWQPMIQEIVAARTAQAAGNLDEAVRLASSVAARARASKELEPLAAALLMLGQAQSAKGEFEVASATLYDAIRTASEVREDGMVVEAWLEIIAMAFRDRPADRELEHAIFSAELAAFRLPKDDPLRAQLAYNVGSVRLLRGDIERAHDQLREAHTLYGRDATRYRYELAAVENSLALIHVYRGEWSEARRYLDRALAVWESIGSAHPNAGATLGIIGDIFGLQHDFARAEPHLVRALAILEAAGGGGRPLIGKAQFHLGYLYARTGRCSEAKPLFARSREVSTALHGAESAMVGLTMYGDGLCELESGDASKAVATLERAKRLAAEHPASLIQLPATDFALARALVEAGKDRPRALELAERARQGYARFPGARADTAAVEVWLAAHP
jgi:tetratricopeptide (TPR) repeat protein/predicted Ser/Thr protein kinase